MKSRFSSRLVNAKQRSVKGGNKSSQREVRQKKGARRVERIIGLGKFNEISEEKD